MKIFAVVVTYNPSILKLKEFISSLHNVNDLSVVIVDNGSKNDDEILALQDSKTFVLLQNENKGIAFAQNIGIIFSESKAAEYIVFFDQDSTIDNNFIDNLISDYYKILNDNEKVAAIGPRFLDEKSGFYFPALKLNNIGLIDKIDIENIKEPIEVSVLISSGTLVSLKVLNDIGLMKEEFFIDFVDTEWCFRAIAKGYKLFISQRAVMKHSIGDDTIQLLNFKIPVHSGFRRYFRIRNLFFMWKMPYIPKILTFKLMVSNFFHQILLMLLKNNKKDYVKYYIKAVKDGLRESKKYYP